MLATDPGALKKEGRRTAAFLFLFGEPELDLRYVLASCSLPPLPQGHSDPAFMPQPCTVRPATQNTVLQPPDPAKQGRHLGSCWHT